MLLWDQACVFSICLFLTQIEVIQLPPRLGKLISPITTNNLLHTQCWQSLQRCCGLNGDGQRPCQTLASFVAWLPEVGAAGKAVLDRGAQTQHHAAFMPWHGESARAAGGPETSAASCKRAKFCPTDPLSLTVP